MKEVQHAASSLMTPTIKKKAEEEGACVGAGDRAGSSALYDGFDPCDHEHSAACGGNWNAGEWGRPHPGRLIRPANYRAPMRFDGGFEQME